MLSVNLMRRGHKVFSIHYDRYEIIDLIAVP